MSSRRSLLLIAVIAIWTLAACNWTVGECWRRGEGSEGAGAGPGDGSIILSTGSGDFYDVPPDAPQYGSEPPPECNKRDEGSEERPNHTPKGPTGGQCPTVDATAVRADTLTVCSSACSGRCPESGVNGPYSPAIFRFATVIPDDGADPAGGWQEASANLKVIRIRVPLPEIWHCSVTIGMPLRTAANGPISSSHAAAISAQVANQAANKVKRESPDMPQGIFCTTLRAEMLTIFKSIKYRSFGARVLP